jgi:hypothetical protein
MRKCAKVYEESNMRKCAKVYEESNMRKCAKVYEESNMRKCAKVYEESRRYSSNFIMQPIPNKFLFLLYINSGSMSYTNGDGVCTLENWPCKPCENWDIMVAWVQLPDTSSWNWNKLATLAALCYSSWCGLPFQASCLSPLPIPPAKLRRTLIRASTRGFVLCGPTVLLRNITFPRPH